MNVNIDVYRKLPVVECTQLVEGIWDSVAAENPDSLQLSGTQKRELRRRVKAHHDDPLPAIPWEQVRDKLFQSRT